MYLKFSVSAKPYRIIEDLKYTIIFVAQSIDTLFASKQ